MKPLMRVLTRVAGEVEGFRSNPNMFFLYWNRFMKNPLTLIGACALFSLVLLAFVAPFISPYDPLSQNILGRLQAPSAEHWFGTDELGRDVFSRVLFGISVSLKIGFIATVVSIVIGTSLGLVSGYLGGWVDSVIMRIVDVMLCFPTLFLILMILGVLDKPSISLVMLVIGLTSWPGLTRMVRGEVLSVRERDYILVAKGLGLSTFRVLFAHLLPNVISPVLVAATFSVGGAILTESALSFLGLGVQPPTPSWGNILMSGKDFIHIAWWLSLYPGLAILVTTLSLNMLGEGLRDVLDPRL